MAAQLRSQTYPLDYLTTAFKKSISNILMHVLLPRLLVILYVDSGGHALDHVCKMDVAALLTMHMCGAQDHSRLCKKSTLRIGNFRQKPMQKDQETHLKETSPAKTTLWGS